jgi:hypothetical protein
MRGCTLTAVSRRSVLPASVTQERLRPALRGDAPCRYVRAFGDALSPAGRAQSGRYVRSGLGSDAPRWELRHALDNSRYVRSSFSSLSGRSRWWSLGQQRDTTNLRASSRG